MGGVSMPVRIDVPMPVPVTVTVTVMVAGDSGLRALVMAVQGVVIGRLAIRDLANQQQMVRQRRGLDASLLVDRGRRRRGEVRVVTGRRRGVPVQRTLHPRERS